MSQRKKCILGLCIFQERSGVFGMERGRVFFQETLGSAYGLLEDKEERITATFEILRLKKCHRWEGKLAHLEHYPFVECVTTSGH